MLKFLTTNIYSPLDIVWFAFFTRAWSDGLHLTAITVGLVGAFMSGALTELVNRRHAQRHGRKA